MKKRVKLTGKDIYKANDREYMEANPEIRDALFKIQKNCKPRGCEECYFFRVLYDAGEFIPECSIGDVTYNYDEYGKRPTGCPIDTGVMR